MHSSIRMGVASYSSRTRQASKIAMAADRSCASRAASSHSSNASSLTAGMRVRRSQNATLIAVEIVRKNPDQIGFAVQPPRWAKNPRTIGYCTSAGG